MKKIVFLLLFSISFMFAKFTSVDANDLVKMQKQGIVVIDIRTPQEWKDRGIIKGAKTIEFFKADGSVDFVGFMKKFTKYVKNSKQPFILYCAHANRSKVVGKLFDQLGIENVYELKGGIEYGWIEKGRKTVKYKTN